jgi:ATP/maltotriose-dependent transcriptional regulator MalT
MASAAESAIEALLFRGHVTAAARGAVDRGRSEHNAHGKASLRRLAAGVFAIAGDERGIAGVTEPQLLSCRTQTEAVAQLAAFEGGPRSHDYLTAGVILSWAGDATGAFACLVEARDRGVFEERFHVAVAAGERLAHHALLFGNLALARDAIERAASLASSHELPIWRLQCVATAAQMALDAGDFDRAQALLEEGRATARTPDLIALFAPAGAHRALVAQDAAALDAWTSPVTLETALHSRAPQAALAATIALLLGARTAPPLAPLTAAALRRALLQTDNPANAPELFSMAARCGDVEEAQFAVDALRAVFAAHRPYLKAHYLLASAHLQVRGGDRSSAFDRAGEAARAFDAIGIRRWTNEAMLLLVHHGRSREPQRRRRPTALSLTRREEQVAQLIRRGASNREVASTLQISAHTVERHVSSILSRLGLRSRWQIADVRGVNVEH